MAPDLIIKYVNATYEQHWSIERSLTMETFGELIGPWLKKKLNDSDYHRLRMRRTTPNRLLAVLAVPEALEKIEAALACPGLFACQDEAEIDALMDRLGVGFGPLTDLAGADDSLAEPMLLDVGEVPLSAGEAASAQVLTASTLKQGKRVYLACWSNPPVAGSSLLTYTVARDVSTQAGVQTYVAQPYANACTAYLSGSETGLEQVPFDRALRVLAKRLGISGSVLPQALLDKLLETNSTLFVLHADCLVNQVRGQASLMHRLLLEAKNRTAPRTSKCIPIVLVGVPKDEKIASRITRFHEQPIHKSQTDAEAAQERGEFFERQWRRYCELRGMPLGAESGNSRLKRVRHYYLSGTTAEAWPANLRMHAFFASNFRTFGYFDPTGGWTRMTGMEVDQLPFDIRLHLGEVVNRLRSVDEGGKRWAELRAIRWCSTAVYWLTQDAALVLGKELNPRTELETFHNAVISQEGLIEIARLEDEWHASAPTFEDDEIEIHPQDRDKIIYKMDLATRAAVQDRWMRMNPAGRAQAHYEIALRLHKSMDDKEMLRLEFPFEPHWGRSRLHFLVECIRHMVRACSPVPLHDGQAKFAVEGAETIPRPPASKSTGCDPYEVINYCFGQLYWRDLNGNGHSKHQTTRKLALRHGAYHLTAELLQLMSDDQQLGKPHWALNEIYVTRYLREVGFAQLDLGDLNGAKTTFETLIARAHSNAQDPLDFIDFQLDLSVVLASMDDLAGAHSALANARNNFETILASDTPCEPRLTLQIKTRISARLAHLAYLRRNFPEALAHCEEIVKSSPTTLARDVAHTYISTLGAMDEPQCLELAMTVCVRQLFDNTSRGLHHEALGFRVALGHVLRKLELYDAAEAALDGAYEDILKYGCSERTYLALLLEAGRILFKQGRYLRAYAAYLRPCLDRAHQRGYGRTARRAHVHAMACLEHLLDQVPPEGWTRVQIEEQWKGRGDYLLVKRAKKIDTKYAYDLIAFDRWLPRLQNQAALTAEIEGISSLG